MVSRTDVTLRTPAEAAADRREAARRARTGLRVVAITLTWLVTVALLIGWGVADPGPNDGTNAAAALCGIVMPFAGAVLATRSRMAVVGGVYAAVTLAMVLPALGMMRGG